MDHAEICNNLFFLLQMASLVIMLILLVNNFVFYRRKFTDDISILIILGLATTLSEILWSITDHPDLIVLTYIFAISFVIIVIAFASMFNRYFLKFFGIYPKRKWVIFLIFGIPNILAFGFSVTTPWSGLVFYTEGGYLLEGILFQSAFYIIVGGYFFAALIVAIYYLIRNKKHHKATKKIIFTLIGFNILAPLFLVIQYFFLGVDSNYIVLCLCFALALIFLVSNLSTLSLLESEAKMKEIETELKIASKIQESALPPSAPNFKDKFELALRASMKTAKDVGGDFYDYFPIDDKRFCFLIADVSGKGAPAALFMMTAKTVIKDHAMIYDDTSKIFSYANNRLFEGNKETMFATAWIAILNLETMTLQYTNAGHNYPLLYRKNGELQLLKKVDGTVLGMMKGLPYRSNTISVEPGDRIYLYTDGVTEAHDPEGKLYGEERLMNVFKENINNSEEEIIDAISNDIIKFSRGTAQFDDITMMVLTIK